MRPYITYNTNRLQLGVYEKEIWLTRALQGKPVVFSKDIADRETTLTRGSDVARYIKGILGNDRAKGAVFNVASGISLKWQEVLDIYIVVLKELLGIEHIPTVYTEYAIVGKHQHYQYIYDRLFERRFDSSKIIAVTGDEKGFETPQNGLEECLRGFFFEQAGKLPAFRDWRLEGCFDRVAHCSDNLLMIKGIKNKVKYGLYRYLL